MNTQQRRKKTKIKDKRTLKNNEKKKAREEKQKYNSEAIRGVVKRLTYINRSTE